VLKKGNVYLSLHTNGVLLDDSRISKLKVDDIALPLDSLNLAVHAELRGEKFTAVVKNFAKISKNIKEHNIKLGVHTVFTALNRRQMPALYKFLDNIGFDYWRIYEINTELVLPDFTDAAAFQRHKMTIDSLRGPSTPEKGNVDDLFGYFLVEEEKIKKLRDSRVEFVARRDAPAPYAFLYNSGDVGYYLFFSNRVRPFLGNVFKEKFDVIGRKLKEVDAKQMDYDKQAQEDWGAFLMDQPIWVRLYDGNFDFEETDMIKPRYLKKVLELERLFRKREYGEESLKGIIMI
jgi:MoaA/NifB/PqqE/SkfB family radical SAM enzyme